MKFNKSMALPTTVLFVALAAFRQDHKTELRNDFKKYYDQYKVGGSFVLYDQEKDTYIYYNERQSNEMFCPASTFKICNSLIGLETGVISDADFVIKWDGKVWQNTKWNKDHDLESAFKNSTVWYYRELAKRVGGADMKSWLDKARYGNADTTGGIDQFWLKGGLRISPAQQISFLKRFHDNELPFSKRNVAIVKQIMIVKDTLGYVVRAKSGWSDEEKRNVGWYIGYVEKAGKVYYFSNCIQTSDLDNNDFAKARIEIVTRILNELKITK